MIAGEKPEAMNYPAASCGVSKHKQREAKL
jgi:hypothetical protein